MYRIMRYWNVQCRNVLRVVISVCPCGRDNKYFGSQTFWGKLRDEFCSFASLYLFRYLYVGQVEMRYGRRIPVEERFSAAVQTSPGGPSSPLQNGYRVSFPGVKRPRRGVNRTPSSSSKVKERVELYLYSSSGSSWHVLGRICLTFTQEWVRLMQSVQRFATGWTVWASNPGGWRDFPHPPRLALRPVCSS